MFALWICQLEEKAETRNGVLGTLQLNEYNTTKTYMNIFGHVD